MWKLLFLPSFFFPLRTNFIIPLRFYNFSTFHFISHHFSSSLSWCLSLFFLFPSFYFLFFLSYFTHTPTSHTHTHTHTFPYPPYTLTFLFLPPSHTHTHTHTYRRHEAPIRVLLSGGFSRIHGPQRASRRIRTAPTAAVRVTLRPW